MKLKTPLTLVLLGLATLSFAPTASAGWFSKAREHSPAAAMGDDTFSITRQAHSGFDRDVDRLRAEAREDAELYCSQHGKKLQIITFTEEKPAFSLGYVSVKLVFRAIDPNAPEPAAAAPAAAPGVTPASTATYAPSPAAPVYAPSTSGGFDLYSELLKLDDLRKRGLLTDKEFEKEKKKLLKRSH